MNTDEGFESGANWQKEKDKVIIDKLVAACNNYESILNGLKRLCSAIETQCDASGRRSRFSIKVVQEYHKAKQLLQSIEQDI